MNPSDWSPANTELHDAELLRVRLDEDGARLRCWFTVDLGRGRDAGALFAIGGSQTIALVDWNEETDRLPVTSGGFASVRSHSTARDRALPASASLTERASDFDVSAGTLALRALRISSATVEMGEPTCAQAPEARAWGPLSTAILRQHEAPSLHAIDLDLVQARCVIWLNQPRETMHTHLVLRCAYTGRMSVLIEPASGGGIGYTALVETDPLRSEVRLLGPAINLRAEGRNWEAAFVRV